MFLHARAGGGVTVKTAHNFNRFQVVYSTPPTDY